MQERTDGTYSFALLGDYCHISIFIFKVANCDLKRAFRLCELQSARHRFGDKIFE